MDNWPFQSLEFDIKKKLASSNSSSLFLDAG